MGKTDKYVFNLILVSRILRQYLFHWTCAFAYVSAWCNKDHKQWHQPFIFFIWCLSYTLFITLRLCQAMKCTFSAYWYLPYCLICVTSKLAYSANWQYQLIIISRWDKSYSLITISILHAYSRLINYSFFTVVLIHEICSVID